MKAKKAIEIAQEFLDERPSFFDPDTKASLQLGIEALRHIDLARRSRDVRIIDKLPGETPADE